MLFSFFFFKQKTAYEITRRDWSSDVCSSDLFVNTSLWHTPQACTLMSTCPTPGLGISRSTISKSAPALEIWATFIGATATLVVAISPPMNSQPLLKSIHCYYPFTFGGSP